VDVGIIAINDGGAAAGSNREMPTSILENDEGIVIH
jgi:hypothetical protein